jgi:perosamine synthetase
MVTIPHVNILKLYAFIGSMNPSKKLLFCGPDGAGFRQFFGIGCSHDVTTWFGEGSVYFTYKGRTAIRHACEILKLENRSEVLVPSYNCGSEIDPLIKSGASVVLYRVDRSGMIDLADLNRRITNKTKIIYVTHYFGFPQPVVEIKHLCKKRGIFLIEDCALSLFSRDGSTKLGTFGDIAIFSLTKTLPVPDGGALVINNPDLTKKSWNMTQPNHMTVLRGVLPLLKSQVLRRLSATPLLKAQYTFLFRLLNAKHIAFAQISAKQLDKRPDMLPRMYYDERLSSKAISATTKRMLHSFNPNYIIAKRRQNFSLLLSLLSGCSGIEPLFKELPEGVCPLHFPIVIRNRNQLLLHLKKQAIDAGPWWKGYNRFLPWDDFPDACFLKDNILNIPVHQGLDEGNIRYIAQKLVSIIR